MGVGEELPRITIAVHGRWHAFELAAGLHRRGMLARLLTTYPKFAVRSVVGADADIASAPLLELKRRLHQRLGIGPVPDVAIAKRFGAFAARWLPAGTDILVGWSSATLEAIPVAHGRGIQVVVERGSTHIGHQRAVLADAFRQCGVAGPLPPAEIVERELAEYAAANRIMVLTDYARRTFVDHGVDPAKLSVNPVGVDLSRFTPRRGPREDGPIRVLFVGGAGVRKGVPWLLDAVRHVGSDVQLRLAGPVEAGLSARIAELPGNRVVALGGLGGVALREEYHRADIFCLPSVEEGGAPMALLEAMASGLPVVVTVPAGGGDVVRDGLEGLVVPGSDDTALAAAISRLADDEVLRRRLGAAAAARVGQGYGWDDYVKRAVNIYTELAAAA